MIYRSSDYLLVTRVYFMTCIRDIHTHSLNLSSVEVSHKYAYTLLGDYDCTRLINNTRIDALLPTVGHNYTGFLQVSLCLKANQQI